MATFQLQSWAVLVLKSVSTLKHSCLCMEENTGNQPKKQQDNSYWDQIQIWQFSSTDTWTFFSEWHKLTHSHLLRRKPSLTYSNIPAPVTTHCCHRAPSFQASCGSCERTRSDIRRVLYRHTPVPTVAIASAMGLMRLLCCCIRTSPEICLCPEHNQDGHTTPLGWL